MCVQYASTIFVALAYVVIKHLRTNFNLTLHVNAISKQFYKFGKHAGGRFSQKAIQPPYGRTDARTASNTTFYQEVTTDSNK